MEKDKIANMGLKEYKDLTLGNASNLLGKLEKTVSGGSRTADVKPEEIKALRALIDFHC